MQISKWQFYVGVCYLATSIHFSVNQGGNQIYSIVALILFFITTILPSNK